MMHKSVYYLASVLLFTISVAYGQVSMPPESHPFPVQMDDKTRQQPDDTVIKMMEESIKNADKTQKIDMENIMKQAGPAPALPPDAQPPADMPGASGLQPTQTDDSARQQPGDPVIKMMEESIKNVDKMQKTDMETIMKQPLPIPVVQPPSPSSSPAEPPVPDANETQIKPSLPLPAGGVQQLPKPIEQPAPKRISPKSDSPVPALDGNWTHIQSGDRYSITQAGSLFLIERENSQEKVSGEFNNSVLTTEMPVSGKKTAVSGRITRYDSLGKPARIEWDNGYIFDKQSQSAPATATQAAVKSEKKFLEIRTAKKYIDGKPVDLTNAFSENDRPVHLFFKVTGLPKDSIVEVAWTKVDAKIPADNRLKVVMDGRTELYHAELQPAKDAMWEKGIYRIDLYAGAYREVGSVFMVH